MKQIGQILGMFICKYWQAEAESSDINSKTKNIYVLMTWSRVVEAVADGIQTNEDLTRQPRL